MAKILGLKIPGGKKGLTYLGLGVGAIALILFIEHSKKGGAAAAPHHPMPMRRYPAHHMRGGPMGGAMHHPMTKAALANQIPVKGPPHGSSLGVGGRIAGAYNSGNYMWGSGRIGVPGGGGIAGGYAGYAY
jgi:hypothetical protein